MANLMRTNEGRTTTSSNLPLWDPFETMRQMLEWDPFRNPAGYTGGRAFSPAFDVKELNDRFVLKADLPGVEEKDLDISVAGNRLTVSGGRAPDQTSDGEVWSNCERPVGTFARVFTLPEGVQADEIQAELKQGVLTVHVPKAPEVRPRKIAITSSVTGFADKVKSLFENKETAVHA
jgi:HSP20 family protein